MTRTQLNAIAFSLVLAASPIGLAGSAFAKGQSGHGHASAGHAASHGGGHHAANRGSHAGGKASGGTGGHHSGGSVGRIDGFDTARSVLGLVAGALGR